jgi:hypothetical protein
MKVANELLRRWASSRCRRAAAGKPAADAPTKFVDGGAIGVQLIRGDMSAMGLGTVTRVSGDKLIAFGHPMMNGGIESICRRPIAKVHWILASTSAASRSARPSRPMGALVNDRQAAIVVDDRGTARTFPMSVKIEGVAGAPKTRGTWRSRTTSSWPLLAAMALGNAVETTTGERGDMTWRATSKLKLASTARSP